VEWNHDGFVLLNDDKTLYGILRLPKNKKEFNDSLDNVSRSVGYCLQLFNQSSDRLHQRNDKLINQREAYLVPPKPGFDGHFDYKKPSESYYTLVSKYVGVGDFFPVTIDVITSFEDLVEALS
jgi:hypothetical protein